AGPDLRGREGRVDEAAVVAAHDRDPVAGLDPVGAERPREAVRALVEVAEAELAELVDDRDRVWALDRSGRDRGRRGGSPAEELASDASQLVGANGMDDAGLDQLAHHRWHLADRAELAELDARDP